MIASEVLAFLAAFVAAFLQRLVKGLWEELWQEIFKAVVEAEKQWGEKTGPQKREQVINQILAYIDERAKLTWLQKMIVRMFVAQLVDALVAQVNETLGHDWLAKAQEVKAKLEAALPIV